MKSVLRIEYDPESHFCRLHHSYNKRFVAYLSGGITPSSYRKYLPEQKCWSVHVSRIALVVAFGKRYFDHVDYSSLPPDVQIQIVKILKGSPGVAQQIVEDASPYATLYLLETAPQEVVAASYKALAMKYHPDRGGNPDDFMRIQRAYDAICEK